MDAKLNTLFGGSQMIVQIDVESETPKTETVKVRQFKLLEYPALLPQMQDELQLCALAISKNRQFIESLKPESYEALQQAVRDINAKGFFAFAGRQADGGHALIAGLLMHDVPPEKIQQMLTSLNRKGISSTPSSTAPPPAG
jgi:hypothetical protein